MTSRRNATCRIEGLESRQLLSAVAPSDVEQYMLELLNRARANPSAEAARLGIDLNEGLPAGTISADAKQPLAMNPNIVDAARTHSRWMLDNDVFSHTGANGSNPGNRIANAGYAAAGTFGWGENIAYRSQKPTAPPPVSTTAGEHADLFIDAGIPGRGHRTNMMASSFKEAGIGIAAGEFNTFNALMSAQNFGYFGSASFLTGVAFDDAVTGDDFYTPGEGLAGVTITAVRAGDGLTRSIATWATGGYSLPLPAGTYAVTAAGGELGTAIGLGEVVIEAANVKRDVRPRSGSTLPVPPTPTPPTPPTPPAQVDPGSAGPGAVDPAVPVNPIDPDPVISPTTPVPPPPPAGVIRGAVWNDASANGKREKREAGAAGRTVFLDANDDGTADAGEPTATTDASGAFAFEGLEPGSYRVRVVAPGGWRVTSPGGAARDVGVAGKKAPKLKPFGLSDSVAVGGTLFDDVNGNGTRDAGEPGFRKAKVFLDLDGDGVRQKAEPTAKIDKAGTWRFAGLAAGTYHVRLILKPTFAITAPAGGALEVDVSTPSVASLENLIGVGTAVAT